MRRLRESDSSDALIERAKSLLEAVGPLPDSELRAQRIRRALDRPRPRALFGRRLPALGVAAGVALFGASAFAAVRFVVEHAGEPAVDLPAAVEREDERAPRRKPRAIEAVQEQEQLVPPVEEPADADDPAPQRAPRRARQTQREVEPVAELQADEPAPVSHDSALVHRAVRALRREHNPRLAARLLQEHRLAYPDSPLAEEVLSLRIEAAVALSDARAGALAREYVTRYPHGRYAHVARQALPDAMP
jgi:hypothetical protein